MFSLLQIWKLSLAALIPFFAKEFPSWLARTTVPLPILTIALRDMEKPSQESIAGKMAQLVKVLITKPSDLNLIPRTDMVERGNQQRCPLASTWTHMHNKLVSK